MLFIMFITDHNFGLLRNIIYTQILIKRFDIKIFEIVFKIR